jgi:GntR family transcriptional regulator / MocR family aminotransferase
MVDQLGHERLVARRICEAIKEQIRQGVFGAGDRLPSTRGLASEWGVSRTTVTAAYGQLAAEGYLDTRQGARTTVAHGLAASGPVSGQAKPEVIRLSAYGRRLAHLPRPLPWKGGPVVDFRYGDLSTSDFPTLSWKRAIGRAILRRPARLQYGDPAGSVELRTALAGYLWRARGLRCEPNQIVIVNGSQQGLDLSARLLLDPGDRIIVENPTYPAARQSFIALGAVPVPVDVDGDGLRTDELPDARLAYVTPSHQFPLGSVMSAARRRQLISWAHHADAYIIEDDYDGEYRYDVAPVPALRALDGGERVVYVGTVSKTLSPTLRIGYLVAPTALAQTLAQAKRLADRHAPSLEQDALTDLIENGAYERHVRNARRKNRGRRAALLGALGGAFGDDVSIAGADAGLHVVAWLHRLPRSREQELLVQAADAGLGIYSVSDLYHQDAEEHRPDVVGLVIGYASLSEREIGQGVRRLAQVVSALRAA